jgi:hypothetical protein
MAMYYKLSDFLWKVSDPIICSRRSCRFFFRDIRFRILKKISHFFIDNQFVMCLKSPVWVIPICGKTAGLLPVFFRSEPQTSRD